MQVFCVFICGVDGYVISWSIVSTIFKFILHIAALVVAYLNRKVKVDALNDYKYNLSIIAISSLLNFILIAAYFLLVDRQNSRAAIFSTVTFLDSVVFLTLTFVPKVSFTHLA